MRSGIRILLIGLIGVTALAAGGCRKKLTFERWEALRVGEPKPAVKAALGKPLDERETRLIYTDQNQGIAAEMWFDPRGEGLIYTQWADPIHGIREKGTRPPR